VAKNKGDRSAAQAKAAEMRAAERKREQRKRLLLATGAVVAVLAIIGGLVIAKAASGGSSTPSASTSGSTSANPASAQILKDISSVPPATFDAVGAGTASAFPGKANPPGTPASGEPRVLYIGAEFCPFCAAERWPMAVALSRFGTWTNLGVTHSSSVDTPANVPTLTFHGATLTSSSVSFTGYETTTNQLDSSGSQYVPLDTVSAEDQKLAATYDPKGTIPFIYFDAQYIQLGASYAPNILVGKTQEQIASALVDPTNPISQAIVGSANVLTAAICATTDQKPANVCTSSGVQAGAAKLGS
jgi:hypothetical protein